MISIILEAAGWFFWSVGILASLKWINENIFV